MVKTQKKTHNKIDQYEKELKNPRDIKCRDLPPNKCDFCSLEPVGEDFYNYEICTGCYHGIMDYVIPDERLRKDGRFEIISYQPIFRFRCPNKKIISISNPF